MEIKIDVLSNKHVKKNFECGYDLLDSYIRTQAKQDVNRDLSACYVLVFDDDDIVKGYYTLSSSSVRRIDYPDNLRSKLPPSYDNLPTILLGRLALDNSVQGSGYGEYILVDAMNRCAELSSSLGSLAIIVDPIDQKAKSFYKKYGFIDLPDIGKMFIPIKTVKESKPV